MPSSKYVHVYLFQCLYKIAYLLIVHSVQIHCLIAVLLTGFLYTACFGIFITIFRKPDLLSFH